MKCFIHGKKEALAVCKNCGKGMCDDCSKYSNHTGICPECRLNDFKDELEDKLAEKRSVIWHIIGTIALTLLLGVLIITIPIGIVVLISKILNLKKLNSRIDTLEKEIIRLEKVLKRTGEKSFN